jgi:hypothetical protein
MRQLDEGIDMSITDITRHQLKAARGLIGASREDIARDSGLAPATIGALERGRKRGTDLVGGHFESVTRIISAFESHGVRFIPDGVVLQRADRGRKGVVASP